MPKKEVNENDLKTMKTLFCIDNSGSVSGESLYHNTTREIFGKYYKSGDLIYLWGTSKKKLIVKNSKLGMIIKKVMIMTQNLALSLILYMMK